MAHYVKIYLLVFFALFLSGCGVCHVPTATEVVGEYVYKYKSGKIEVWILRQDFTYQQEFYNNIKDYRERINLAFTNSGNWSLSKNKITLLMTLNFYDYTSTDDQALSKPLRVAAQPCDWVAPSSHKDALISIGEDIGYVLRRVSGRDLVMDN